MTLRLEVELSNNCDEIFNTIWSFLVGNAVDELRTGEPDPVLLREGGVNISILSFDPNGIYLSLDLQINLIHNELPSCSSFFHYEDQKIFSLLLLKAKTSICDHKAWFDFESIFV